MTIEQNITFNTEIPRIPLDNIPQKHLIKRHHQLNDPGNRKRYNIDAMGQGWTHELKSETIFSRGFKMCFLLVITIDGKKYLTHVMPNKHEIVIVRKYLDAIIKGRIIDKISMIYNEAPYNFDSSGELHKEEKSLITNELIAKLGSVNIINDIPLQRPIDINHRDFDIMADNDYLTIWKSGILECNNVFNMGDL